MPGLVCLVVRMETGFHGSPRLYRGVLQEPVVGRERPDHRPQGGQVAGEHHCPHQAAEAPDPYHLGRRELRRHATSHEAPYGGRAHKDHGVQT